MNDWKQKAKARKANKTKNTKKPKKAIATQTNSVKDQFNTAVNRLRNGDDLTRDLQADIATHAAKLIVGQGYTSNKDTFQEYLDQTNFTDLLTDLTRNLSYREDGVQAVIVDNDGNDMIRMSPVDMDSSSWALDNTGQVLYATTVRTISYGEREYNVKEIWSNKRKLSTEYSYDHNGETLSISGDDFNMAVPEQFQVEESYSYEELGHAPIMYVKNKPTRDIISEGDGINVRHLTTHYNNLYKRTIGEVEKNKTILVVDPDVKDSNGERNYDMVESDAFTMSRGTNNTVASTPIEMISNSMKLEAYRKELESIFNEVWDANGYSVIIDSGATAKRTATEIFYINKRDLETTLSKINYLNRQFKILVRIINAIQVNTIVDESTELLINHSILIEPQLDGTPTESTESIEPIINEEDNG